MTAKADRLERFFARRGQHEAAGWLARFKDHVRQVGVESAVEAVGGVGAAGGKAAGRGNRSDVQYEGAWATDRVADFVKPYLARHGVRVVNSFGGDDASGRLSLVSSLTPSQGGTTVADRPRGRVKQDYLPRDPSLPDKLQESKRLPGLERSEDLSVILGRKVTHLTDDVTGKLDSEYGKGKWIVKAYGDDAAAGHGIYFPQRAAQLKRDAQDAIWAAGENLARYGMSVHRNAAGRAVGVKDSAGTVYGFKSRKYETHLYGDARHWADKAAAAAPHERGPALPKGGKEFMAQPAFDVLGISDADRAKGVTIKPGEEGRVHLTTRNGKADVIPHSTWLKQTDLPVVFESKDTRDMAAAARKAIESLPHADRDGVIYAADVVRTKDGYRVVEANPANHTGTSGYLGDNAMIIDAYVSHVTGTVPAHVRFARSLLTRRAGRMS